jgi:succinate dehydrogenase / fumarate reductase cytochrome b subunit
MTSWILLVGVIAHVGYMRFYRYPLILNFGKQQYYFTRVNMDPGLYTVADRLGAKVYSREKIRELDENFKNKLSDAQGLLKEGEEIEKASPKGLDTITPVLFSAKKEEILTKIQNLEERKEFIQTLKKKSLNEKEVMVVASDFGTATLLMVRDAYKGLGTGILYTIFVLAAVFHGFNGLWTFMITWGWIIRMRSQSKMVNVCVGLMVLIGFLGLAAIWGPYWINLRN